MRNKKNVMQALLLLVLVLVYMGFMYYKISENKNLDLNDMNFSKNSQTTQKSVENLPKENQNLQIDEIKKQEKQIYTKNLDNKNGENLSTVKFGFQTQNLLLSYDKKRLYAYDDNQNGIAVIDISNPHNLQILGTFHFLNLQQSRTYIDIKESKDGRYLYVVDPAFGLYKLDLSDIKNIKVEATYEREFANKIELNFDDKIAFIKTFGGEVISLDVSSNKIREMGKFNATLPYETTETISRLTHIKQYGDFELFSQNELFLVNPRGFHILDISDPAFIKEKRFFTLPHVEIDTIKLSEDKKTLYATNWKTFMIFDISDFKNIREVSKYKNKFHLNNFIFLEESNLAFLGNQLHHYDESSGAYLVDFNNQIDPVVSKEYKLPKNSGNAVALNENYIFIAFKDSSGTTIISQKLENLEKSKSLKSLNQNMEISPNLEYIQNRLNEFSNEKEKEHAKRLFTKYEQENMAKKCDLPLNTELFEISKQESILQNTKLPNSQIWSLEYSQNGFKDIRNLAKSKAGYAFLGVLSKEFEGSIGEFDENGRVLWHRNISQTIYGANSFFATDAYAIFNNYVFDTQSKRFVYEFPCEFVGATKFENGFVAGDKNNFLYFFQDNKLLWKTAIDSSHLSDENEIIGFIDNKFDPQKAKLIRIPKRPSVIKRILKTRDNGILVLVDKFGFIKFDKNGNEIWRKSFDFENVSIDDMAKLLETPDGSVFLLAKFEALILKFDKDGNELFRKKICPFKNELCGLGDNANANYTLKNFRNNLLLIGTNYGHGGMPNDTIPHDNYIFLELDLNGEVVDKKEIVLKDFDFRDAINLQDSGILLFGRIFIKGKDDFGFLLKIDENISLSEQKLDNLIK